MYLLWNSKLILGEPELLRDVQTHRNRQKPSQDFVFIRRFIFKKIFTFSKSNKCWSQTKNDVLISVDFT